MFFKSKNESIETKLDNLPVDQTAQDNYIKFCCYVHSQDFMRKHNFSSIADFKGASLPYFTTHSDLVQRQREAILLKKSKVGLSNDSGESLSVTLLCVPSLHLTLDGKEK